jgi:hypothetical protein
MLTSRRIVVVVMSCAVTTIAPSLAAAKQTARPINTTQRITLLASTAQSATNVGTSDGKIAGAAVHGALRAVAITTTPSTFTATGTLFYPTGTLNYRLNGTITTNPDGSLHVRGNGKFTSGTGSYVGAQGNFTASGTKPANSFETWTLKGNLSSR